MSLRWYSVVVDCRDIGAQSRWWAEALDWRVAFETEKEVILVPPVPEGNEFCVLSARGYDRTPPPLSSLLSRA